MTCDACGEKPKKMNEGFPKAVVEINNPESLVLLRKVVIPASMGDDTAFPPAIGKYFNVLLHYDANGRNYIYSSDGIPTALDAEVPPEIYERLDDLETGLRQETVARGNADTSLGNRLTTVEGVAATALQPQSIDKVVMTDISLSTNTSTTTVQLDGAKENLLTGTTSTKNIALPVASSTQAGVMNSSTYDAITNNTSNINALVNGAVAITGLSASPSQSDLTTAWQTETGLATLMNRAGIYDVSNNKVWTYYSNTSAWYAASNTSQVIINAFTNNSEGTIKGSTNVGQIFAENDGTGSVNGWDNLSNAVSTNTSDIASLQNTTPVITMTDTDPGEDSPLAANNFVAVYGGDPIIMDYSTSEVNTGAKWIDGSTIYKKTINFGALPNAASKTVAHQISNVSRFIKVEQSITNNGGTGALVLSSGQASNNDFNFYVTDTNVGITTSGDRSTCNAYITLYYTKSSS